MTDTLFDDTLLVPNPLQSLIDAALGALARQEGDTPPHIVELYEQQRQITAKLEAWQKQVPTAIEAYNAARLQLFFQRVADSGLAWCKHGHMAPAREVHLVHIGGAYVSSGYFETLHARSGEFTACKAHAATLVDHRGQYGGEFTTYVVESEPCTTWQRYFDVHRLSAALAEEYGIPPVMKLGAKDPLRGDEPHLMLGKVELAFPTTANPQE